jgi:hypothetical protein
MQHLLADIILVDRRKPKPFPWSHTTPPLESRLIPVALHRPIETTALSGEVGSGSSVHLTEMGAFKEMVTEVALTRVWDR